jgi:hypothetical protein
MKSLIILIVGAALGYGMVTGYIYLCPPMPYLYAK